MRSSSALVSEQRPFYALHAEAYDLLVTDPVEPWVEAVNGRLEADGHLAATLLDAGCGTGRHARALNDRGHSLTLMDASAGLLHIAGRRCPSAELVHGDICESTSGGGYDAVTCRGVLNDLLEDGEREAVLTSFAGRLRPGGLLFLDVREAGESERRADGRWRASVVELPGGRRLRFTSRPSWCAGRIVVDESYALLGGRGESVSVHDYRFQMRPWIATELRTRLGDAGFDHIEILPGVGRRTPDRLFVVARAPAASVG